MVLRSNPGAVALLGADVHLLPCWPGPRAVPALEGDTSSCWHGGRGCPAPRAAGPLQGLGQWGHGHTDGAAAGSLGGKCQRKWKIPEQRRLQQIPALSPCLSRAEEFWLIGAAGREEQLGQARVEN